MNADRLLTHCNQWKSCCTSQDNSPALCQYATNDSTQVVLNWLYSCYIEWSGRTFSFKSMRFSLNSESKNLMWISVHVNGNRFVIFTTESLNNSRLNLFYCLLDAPKLFRRWQVTADGFAKTLNRPSTLDPPCGWWQSERSLHLLGISLSKTR